MNRSLKLISCCAALLLFLHSDRAIAETSAVRTLVQKAESLEGRGRSDLAVQTWQQILASDPNQPDALAGLARNAKRNGRQDEANTYLSRLRKVDPSHPALAQVESLSTVSGQSSRLNEAARLASAHQFEAAMAIYHEVFGMTPPPGGWAIAYYETDASLPGGWERSTAALRKLSEQYPAVPDYKLALGKLLTYRPTSRKAGITMLESISNSGNVGSKARQAWRQALVWEKTNPSNLPAVERYLEQGSDPELKAAAESLASESRRTGSVHVRPGGHDEQLGYEALKAGNVSDAVKYFENALHEDPKSGPALSGMGYARMKQQDFAGALPYLENARRELPHDAALATAVETATFWKVMGEATKAAKGNDIENAKTLYKKAIALRANNTDAMYGLAGTLLRARAFSEAEPILEQLVQADSKEANAWRELVSVRYQIGGAKGVLETLDAMPKGVADQLNTNLEFEIVSASAYLDAGQLPKAKAVYQKVMEQAASRLEDLKPEEQVQVVGLMARFQQSGQAVQALQKLVDKDPNNVDAWEVLLGALVQDKKQKRAVEALQQMPESVYSDGLRRPGFLRAVAAIQAANGKLDEAEEALQKLAEREKASGPGQDVTTRIELVRVYVQKGQAKNAEELLVELTDSSPDNLEVWKAYTNLLHERHRDAEAISITARIPRRVAQRLSKDPDYVSTIAAAQTSVGNADGALRLIHEAVLRAREEGTVVPVRLYTQLAWMLLDAPGGQNELYSVLEQTGKRNDLTSEDVKALSSIWGTWILRTAQAASDAGNLDRALAILQQGSRMLPGDSQIKKSLAGYLLKVGQTDRALVVYQNWGLKGADANDYAGAIGAAMAQRDNVYANAWMQEALAKFGSDSAILDLAGKQAAAHGDYKKAKLYWKAALAAVPPDKPMIAPGLLAIAKTNPSTAATANLASMKRLLLNGDTSDDVEAPMEPRVTGFDSIGMASIRDGVEQRSAMSELSFANTPKSKSETFRFASYEPDSIVSSHAFGNDEVRAPRTGATSNVLASGLSRDQLASNDAVSNSSRSSLIQDEVNSVEGRNSPFLGNENSIQTRSGVPGYSRLLIEQADLQASMTVGDQLRLTISALPTHVESGKAEADPTNELRFGTLGAGLGFAAQAAGGVGADAQISSQSFGFHLGMTPASFLVRNFTGGIRMNPGHGPITFLIDRDNIRDSFLSFAGSRDPVSNQIWGGVVADTAAVLGNWGDARSGFYARVGYQWITGRQVESNHRIDANFGRYWRVLERKEGSLNVGLNLTALHYDHNLRYFTLGQGGYFSPQRYFLANIPVRWNGVYNRRLEYVIAASLGGQFFNEDASPYFPTDASLQAQDRLFYSHQSSRGTNYNFDARVGYQITPNLYLGAFLNANNARYYSAEAAGMFLKYSFEPRSLSLDADVQSVPDWKGRQPFRLE